MNRALIILCSIWTFILTNSVQILAHAPNTPPKPLPSIVTNPVASPLKTPLVIRRMAGCPEEKLPAIFRQLSKLGSFASTPGAHYISTNPAQRPRVDHLRIGYLENCSENLELLADPTTPALCPDQATSIIRAAQTLPLASTVGKKVFTSPVDRHQESFKRRTHKLVSGIRKYAIRLAEKSGILDRPDIDPASYIELDHIIKGSHGGGRHFFASLDDLVAQMRPHNSAKLLHNLDNGTFLGFVPRSQNNPLNTEVKVSTIFPVTLDEGNLVALLNRTLRRPRNLLTAISRKDPVWATHEFLVHTTNNLDRPLYIEAACDTKDGSIKTAFPVFAHAEFNPLIDEQLIAEYVDLTDPTQAPQHLRFPTVGFATEVSNMLLGIELTPEDSAKQRARMFKGWTCDGKLLVDVAPILNSFGYFAHEYSVYMLFEATTLAPLVNTYLEAEFNNLLIQAPYNSARLASLFRPSAAVQPLTMPAFAGASYTSTSTSSLSPISTTASPSAAPSTPTSLASFMSYSLASPSTAFGGVTPSPASLNRIPTPVSLMPSAARRSLGFATSSVASASSASAPSSGGLSLMFPPTSHP